MKQKTEFSIGEVAQMKGLTVKALRFYEEIGLLTPHRIDPFTKYRYYHSDQFLVIELIKAARGMDISPNDLVPFVKAQDTAGLLAFLQMHCEKTRLRLEELKSLLIHIDGVTSGLVRARESAGNPGVYVREMPDLYLYTRRITSAKDFADSAGILSELERKAAAKGLDPTYESGALFEPDASGVFAPTRFFTTVLHGDDPDIFVIPYGRHVCTLIDAESSEEKSNLLSRYCEENKLDVIVITQVELLSDLFGNSNPVEMRFRVQTSNQ